MVENGKTQESSEVDFERIFKLFLSNKKWLIGITFIFVAVTAIVNFYVLDPKYKTQATIMPRLDGGSSKLDGLAGLVGGTASLGQLFGIQALNTELLQFEHLLRSSTFKLQMLKQYDLIPRLIPKMNANARINESSGVRILEKYTELKQDRGVLNIVFVSKNAQLSHDVMKAYVDYLQNYLKDNVITRAQETEQFIHQRLGEVQIALAESEQDFIRLQHNSGIIELPTQANLSMSTIAQLRAKLIEKDMEKELYRNILYDETKIHQLEREKEQIQSQIDAIVTPSSSMISKKKSQSSDILAPLSKVPDLNMKFAKTKREYLTQIKLLELLRQQYEFARIDSKRNEMMFQVIEAPKVPIFPYRPRKVPNTLIGGFLGALVSILWVLVREKVRKVPQPETVWVAPLPSSQRPKKKSHPQVFTSPLEGSS